jgi:hypothetical protein
MSDNYILETYRQLRISQDKYTYFMLAASGSAIAYALNRAQDRLLSWLMLPWGMALLFWALSFYFGCKHLAYVSSTLYANIELLKVERGEHPDTGMHPQLMSAASEGIRAAIESNSERANSFAHLQFAFFIAGVVSYVIWQLLEMYVATFF